ncbi:Uncharacterised protein [Serratia fonticola]|uniref:Uncharacterized protein n=1 Tax=Serratia fonticola TaxID=47917 RepID=A0A4U9VIV8_SERFO|nr:Uncharacterised protein [Serratia fonticola]
MLDGESQSLGCASDEQLSRFGDKARQLGLDVHIETSASDAKNPRSGGGYCPQIRRFIRPILSTL